MTETVYAILTIGLSAALGYMVGLNYRMKSDNDTFLFMLRQMVALDGDDKEDGE